MYIMLYLEIVFANRQCWHSEKGCALLKTSSTSSQKTVQIQTSPPRMLVRSGLMLVQGYKPKIKWLFPLTCCLHATGHAHTALGELVPANWGYSPGCRHGGWGRHERIIKSWEMQSKSCWSGGRLLNESKRNVLGNASCWGSLSQMAAPANQDCALSGEKEKAGSSFWAGACASPSERTCLKEPAKHVLQGLHLCLDADHK